MRVERFFLLFLFVAVALGTQLPPDIHKTVQTGSCLIFSEKYSDAVQLFNKLIKKYPDHPAGYFYKAVTLNNMMLFNGSMEQEREFYSLCDAAVEKCEKSLERSPRDSWMLYFLGGAMGFKGSYEARHFRYVSAFRYGWTGLTKLLEAKQIKPDWPDVDYGIGLYNYWKSRMMRKMNMWWLPGGEDKLEVGIEQVQNACRNGSYAQTAAAYSLLWIFFEEGRFQEMADMAQRLLVNYPHNRTIEWALGEALFQLGDYNGAERIFSYILDMVDSKAGNTFVFSIIMRVRLARVYMKKKLYYKAMAECRRVRQYRVETTYKEDVRSEIQDAECILNEALKAELSNMPE